jgi:hypothetical protein
MSWKSLSPNLKKEFCSFSGCVDRCNGFSSGICSCPKWEKGNYDFLKKITQKLDDDVKLQLCELTECSYKNSGPQCECPCEFYSGKKRKTDSQYCSNWFRIKDLSVLLDPISVVIVKKKIDIDDVDELVQEIANRWNVEIA